MAPRDIYIMLQIMGIILIVFELLYVAFQKPSDLQKHLIFILLTLGVSSIGYLIELLGQNIETSYVGCCLGYVGKPFALVSSLLLLLEYANIKVKKRIVVPVLVFFLFLTTMVITNQYHHLYYAKIGFSLERIGSPLIIVERGPLWYVYMASSFLIFALYALVVAYEYKFCKNRQAKHMCLLLFCVVFFAFVGLFLFICGWTYGYDSTLSGIMIGSIFLLILLTRYRMFDSLTLAQYKSLNDSENGIIVLDARMTISYHNSTADKIIPSLLNMNRKKETEIIKTLDEFKQDQNIFINDKVYSISIDTTYAGKRNKLVGKTYRFDEITEHYYYQERLNDDINKATIKIKNIQRKALKSFADVVEARDGNTGEHILNVAKTARLIAESLKENSKHKHYLTESKINIIEEVAPLHDIGKIYVSDTILLKPAKLTKEEFEIMKIHAKKGGEIIEQSITGIEEPEYVKIASEIATYHHERFDGTGYPNGLKGDEIPLCARIVAVADVYDALRMERPYKKSFSKDDAINIVKEETGTHFDPEVTAAFLKIVSKLN